MDFMGHLAAGMGAEVGLIALALHSTFRSRKNRCKRLQEVCRRMIRHEVFTKKGGLRFARQGSSLLESTPAQYAKTILTRLTRTGNQPLCNLDRACH